jgi:hypothetical protein
MDGFGVAARELSGAETGLVGGGDWSAEAFAASTAAGAVSGAPIGAFVGIGLLGFGGAALGAFMGGLVGGALGGVYYAASELLDGCY